MIDARRDSPSFHRNIGPITAKLHAILTNRQARVIEIGSGSGQHVARFSSEFPDMSFQPTEYDETALKSIDAWTQGAQNVRPALHLDVTSETWLSDTSQRFDILLCFNVIHISPWIVTTSIFDRAGEYMNEECQLLFYGAFKINGQHTSESNAEFDTWLKDKDPGFGIRDIADISKAAAQNGFKLGKSHTMPANNFIQEFVRA